jgi:hypothetical protein
MTPLDRAAFGDPPDHSETAEFDQLSDFVTASDRPHSSPEFCSAASDARKGDERSAMDKKHIMKLSLTWNGDQIDGPRPTRENAPSRSPRLRFPT